MNCRRISGLLSAFLDGELTGEEMLDIRAHLDVCEMCRLEHQSLHETKMLLASLAYKAPRAELEALLIRHGVTGAPAGGRGNEANPGGLRPFPIAATMFFSLAGLWLASTALNAPGDTFSDSVDHVRPMYPAMVFPGGYTSPVALSPEPVAPPAGWTIVPVSGGGVSVVPASESAGNVPNVPVPQAVTGFPGMSQRLVSSYSVTTMSDGRGETVRIVSTTSGPGMEMSDNAPVGMMPGGMPQRASGFGINVGSVFTSVRVHPR